MAEDLMTVKEVGERLGVAVQTLYHWRAQGTGPPAFRLGRSLRYRRQAVEEWINLEESKG